MKKFISIAILVCMIIGVGTVSSASTVTRTFDLNPGDPMECGMQSANAGSRQFYINVTTLNYSGINPNKDLHATVYSSNGVIYERHFNGTGISQRSYTLSSRTDVGLGLENEGSSKCTGSVQWNATYR